VVRGYPRQGGGGKVARRLRTGAIRVNISAMGRERFGRDPAPNAPRRFQTTRWSLIVAARGGDAREARAALADLCAAYWYPLYAFVRKKGYDPDMAQDLVQGFFARLLEKGDLESVDRVKGKFRSFLMASCSHFIANQSDRDRALKRGGGKIPISIDRQKAEGRYVNEPGHELTAERLFERRWATTLLENVIGSIEAEMAAAGKARQLEVLRPALMGAGDRIPYASVAAELGISEDAARASAHRLRRRFRERLREEVASTIDDPAGVDDEIHSLFAALGTG
jgi:DNA-directed RNA polymerase specialized sigma24 family protein